MQIQSLHVKNFRCLKDATISFEKLTALIGGNNAGKSTFLKAIEYFFEASPKLTKNDFFLNSYDEDIEVTIEFKNFTPDEISEFGDAIIGERMIVTRQFSLTDKDKSLFAVHRKGFKGFTELRNTDGKQNQLNAYKKLREEMTELPNAKKSDEIAEYLDIWEKKNTTQLSLQKDRGFFGAINVAIGKLKNRTGVHLIPAVRDATEDATNPKDSAIIELLSNISRQTIENKQEMKEFLEKTKNEFEKLSDPSHIPELKNISAQLTGEIQKYYSDAELTADWQGNEEPIFKYAKPSLTIKHRGVQTDLSHVGHGLQRAALFSVVQYLAEHKSLVKGDDAEFENAASDIIILVEEPEIYQHPSKQLVIYEAFKKITESFNKSTGIRVQIIYATHSEKFINMSDFHIARIIKNELKDEKTINSVSGITISECSQDLAKIFDHQIPMSNDALCAKLHIFTREVCEGFFAKKIILVEGVTDKATLEAAYISRGRDIHQEAISIIALKGKDTLDKPYHIFSKLGIPTFMIFDSDKPLPSKNPTENEIKKLIIKNIFPQKIAPVKDICDWPNGCYDHFYAFEHELETYLQNILNDTYEEIFKEISTNWGLPIKQIKKTPAALSSLFVKAKQRGYTFPAFDEIIDKIDAL